LLLSLILSLYSLSSWASLEVWVAESLSFYCPSLSSVCKSLFYPVNFLKSSFIWLNCLANASVSPSLPWYYLIYLFLDSTMLFSLSISLVTNSILFSYSLSLGINWDNSLSFLFCASFYSRSDSAAYCYFWSDWILEFNWVNLDSYWNTLSLSSLASLALA
jgi:hypothetical protein